MSSLSAFDIGRYYSFKKKKKNFTCSYQSVDGKTNGPVNRTNAARLSVYIVRSVVRNSRFSLYVLCWWLGVLPVLPVLCIQVRAAGTACC